MKDISISVVIPCYNCVETIEECIRSISIQTQKVLEVIAVDDGSTDKTLDLLMKLKVRYAGTLNIVVINQENQGPSTARNVGISKAKGNWIAFLDSDDLWHKSKIEVQVEEINNHPNALFITAGKGKLDSLPDSFKKVEVDFKKLCFKNYCLTSSTLVRKDSIKDLRFNTMQKHSEDYRFFLELLQIGGSGICIIINLSCSINFKRDYGESGLSGNIIKMQKGEISNFLYLRKVKSLQLYLFLSAVIFSYLKFIRRIILNNIHKILKNDFFKK